MTYFTGKDLIEAGLAPGPVLGATLAQANAASDRDTATAIVRHAVVQSQAAAAAKAARLDGLRPTPRDDPPGFAIHLTPQTEDEVENAAAVQATMQSLMRTPTLEAGAVMPDACPAGPKGTIPVGGVVAARGAIHPGMHSADICCSLFATAFKDVDPAEALDAIHGVTHFGPGGRGDFEADPPTEIIERMRANPFFTEKAIGQAWGHFGTQGDGNHFAYVGRSEGTGQVTLVTHHGSRGMGAQVYKAGMAVAERYRLDLSPATQKQNAWIPFAAPEGPDYWDALQIVRDWTKANHAALHGAVARALGRDSADRWWNEHNFVFRDPADGDLFWHAKGATPVESGFLPDTDGRQIVPLNMAQPILVVKGERTPHGLGFAPHGAGRNLSRTAHTKRLQAAMGADYSEEAVFARETQGIDARFFCGNIDVSELPSAYKDADAVTTEMARAGLARVTDRIQPFGAIMAGDWERDTPWRRKRAAKAAARAAQ
ncbi:MAG: RtcB family protein [Pseudomonadota bacterium]